MVIVGFCGGGRGRIGLVRSSGAREVIVGFCGGGRGERVRMGQVRSSTGSGGARGHCRVLWRWKK